MPARVLVIGLDAAEATLIEGWAEAGELPTFARLAESGAVFALDRNPLETLPGAIWPELTTGRSCGALPLYYHPQQLHTGEARLRPILAQEVDPGDYYWAVASAAGRRVAVIDQVQTVPTPDLNGIQLFEWGLHDRNFAIAADPPGLLDDVRRRFGDHPITSCDLHGRSASGYRALREKLLAGVARKTELLLELMGREAWDLFTCTFGETHCVGHQFWHFRDAKHPDHDDAAPDAMRHAIRDVYRAIDDGVARLVREAGEDAALVVVASHGMGVYTGGPQLLPEFLVRLGLGSGGDGRASSAGVRRAQILVTHVPRPLQPALRRLAESAWIRRFQARSGCLLYPLESPSTRAAALKNNRCGAIRLNLSGREPFGRIAPGAQQAALVAEIRGELLALRQPASGEPIVERVVTADEAFGAGHHPDVPDLMVVFRTDLGVLEDCRSPRVGDIHVDLFHPNIPRSGDHTTESRMWLRSEGVAAGARLTGASTLDLAPTVLSLLEVAPPRSLGGRSLAPAPAPVLGRAS